MKLYPATCKTGMLATCLSVASRESFRVSCRIEFDTPDDLKTLCKRSETS